MSNVAHSTLTGSNIHEPKGVATANAGEVYIANGSGSGAWTASTAAVPGQVSDFFTPVAPSGWLEMDGSVLSTTTYAALYTALTIQQSGSRGSGSAIISGLSSTTNMRAGYYVFGTGITSGTTIASVDSSTQITMSATASSGGTATVLVSACLLNTGTFTLPNVTTSGRFRRSRTSTLHLGVTQADQNAAHTHIGTTAQENIGHTHTGTTGNDSPDHTHLGGDLFDAATTTSVTNNLHNINVVDVVNNSGGGNTGGVNGNHTHAFTTGDVSAFHTHTFTSNSSGGTEARPLTLIVMTCIKT